MGRGAQNAGFIEHRLERIEVRRAAPPRDRSAEVGVSVRKAATTRVVFFGFARAGGVNQTAARSHGLGRVAKHLQLRSCERREIGLGPPPSDVRIAPDRAEARAWRIDEHHVELRPERQSRLEIGLEHADVLRTAGAARFREAVARGRCAHLSATISAASPPSRPSLWSCRPAMRRCRAPAFPASDRRAATTNVMLRPEGKTARCRQAAFAADFRASRPVHRERNAPARPRHHVARSAPTNASRSSSERFTRIVSGAAALLNCSHPSAASNPYRPSHRSRASPGWEARLRDREADRPQAAAAEAAACANFARCARSTALTSPAALVFRARRVIATASFTAAAAGTRSRWSS